MDDGLDKVGAGEVAGLGAGSHAVCTDDAVAVEHLD